MQGDGLGDLLADGLERVQAGHGVLHHHGNLTPADGKPLFFGLERRKVQRDAAGGGVVVDAAAGDAAVRVQQAHKAFGEHTFAGAALAHKGKHLAPVKVEVDVPDGVQGAPAQPEPDLQAAHREDGVLGHGVSSLLQMVLGVGGVREGVADQVKGDGDKA